MSTHPVLVICTALAMTNDRRAAAYRRDMSPTTKIVKRGHSAECFFVLERDTWDKHVPGHFRLFWEPTKLRVNL